MCNHGANSALRNNGISRELVLGVEMDRERFDALARLCATSSSRRVALGALLSTGLAGAAGVAEAAKKDRTKNRKSGKKGRDSSQVSAQAATCSSPGPSSNLSGCNYDGEDFSGDDLSGSRMVGTTFRNAELTGSNLSSSNLKDASFRGADLCGADLSSSTLRNVDFRGFGPNQGSGRPTNLTLADLSSSGGCGTLQTNGRTIFCGTTMCDGSVRNDDCPENVDPEDICCSECEYGVECVDGRCSDCGDVLLVSGPPAQAQMTFQRPGGGIVSILVTRSENADTVVPPFIPGTTEPIDITSTKIDQTQQARVEIRVTVLNGDESLCRLSF